MSTHDESIAQKVEQTSPRKGDTTVLPDLDSMDSENSFTPSESSGVPYSLLLTQGIAILALSIFMNIFLIRENNTLLDTRKKDQAISDQYTQNETAIRSLLEDIAKFSLNHPDARQILTKYGVNVNFVQVPPPEKTGETPDKMPGK